MSIRSMAALVRSDMYLLGDVYASKGELEKVGSYIDK